MDLTELQTELRLMEQQLVKLQTEVEKMKPQPEDERKKNYETINRLAQLYPLKNAGLESAPYNIKKLFIRGLSFLLQTEIQEQYSRILYLCRLSAGSGMDLSAEDILRLGVNFNAEDIGVLCIDLSDYKYPFLTEAFILANLPGKCSGLLLGMIVAIAEIMKCDREEIQITAQIAKSVLTGNPDVLSELPVPSRNRWSGKFRDYIPQEWIEGQRKKCAELHIQKDSGKYETLYQKIFWMRGEVPTEKLCKVIEQLQSGTVVKKGQYICSYEEKTLDKQTFVVKTAYKTVTAPCDGIVFFVNDERKSSEQAGEKEKYLLIYVVSWFDDYDDFCAWRKNNADNLYEGGTV